MVQEVLHLRTAAQKLAIVHIIYILYQCVHNPPAICWFDSTPPIKITRFWTRSLLSLAIRTIRDSRPSLAANLRASLGDATWSGEEFLVLMLDGSAYIVARMFRETGSAWIKFRLDDCCRYRSEWLEGVKLRIPFTRAHRLISYHLISVQWDGFA